jgi:hypothetical protein
MNTFQKAVHMLESQKLDQDTIGALTLEVPKTGVLTAVCNVNPGSQVNQGAALRIRIKNALSQLELPDVLKNAVMDDLSAAQTQTRTRIYYLWDEHGHLKSRMVDVQLELPEVMRFGKPDFEPLRVGLESTPLTAIVLIDREWRRLFTVHLGEIHELHDPEIEADKTGVLGRDTDKNQREQHDDQVFWRKLIDRITQLHQQVGFVQLLIAGPPEVRSSFLEQLPSVLQDLLVGQFIVLGDATPAHVLEAAQESLEEATHNTGTKLLADVLAHGLRGSETTLTAVQEGRVYELLVAGDASGIPVWRDTQGYIFTTYPAQGISPLTGLGVEGMVLRDVLPDLRERFGLRVHFLQNDLATRLETEMGGMGGLPHYKEAT